MLGWLKRPIPLAVLLFGGILVGLLFTVDLAQQASERSQFNPATFDRLRDQLRQRPYDGALLLRVARHGVEMTRHLRRENGSDTVDLEPMVITSLEAYRRLEASPEWDFSPRDQFNAAYLYHQLGKLQPEVDYLSRAREAALRSYERGYRSNELNTLLGNLHYELGEYKLALNFYQSLGDVRDPVVLFNRAWTNRQLGNYERADELLRRAQRVVEVTNRDMEMIWDVREARLVLRLDSGEPQRVLDVLADHPDWVERPEIHVLQARAHMELGNKTKARADLETLVENETVARKARVLLENLDDST